VEDATVQPEAVPPVVSELALRLLGGWQPPDPPMGRVAQLRWADQDVSSAAGSLTLRGDALDLEWDHQEPFFLMSAVYKTQLRGKSVVGTLRDGRSLKADTALFPAHDTLRLHYWEIARPNARAKLWLARLSAFEAGGAFATNGNLVVVRRGVADDGTPSTHMTAGHYRLVGAYTYYLLRTDDGSSWFLVIDAGTERVTPERGKVFVDVLALQFVLGRALYFDVLVGLDGTDVVALVGGRHGRDHSRSQRAQPPVPLDFTRECWAAHLFEKLSADYQTRPELRFYVALTFYLDALAAFHVEGRYLAFHVALESFAYRVLQASSVAQGPLVDRAKWRAWLAESKERIQSLAAPGQAETLFSKITSIPARRAASRVVEDAFLTFGVPITPEMALELEEGRGRIVHTASMFDQRQEDVDAYLSRIAVVRTMLVALVAKVVGYQGAILGWTKEDGRPYDEADPAWWTVDDEAKRAASVHFVIGDRSSG
jgi:hypothetical protein